MSPSPPYRLVVMPDFDLHRAADQMADLVRGVPDDALGAPTPCEEMPVAGLLGHVEGFAVTFTAAAAKDLGPLTGPQPPGPPADFGGDWRTRIATELATLADAWDAPAAWEGMTQAGGVDLPGAVAARVALDELAVHGWDLARATGQTFRADDDDLAAVEATVRQFRGENDGEIPGLFGPRVTVPEDAPLLDQILALTGRDPGWHPPA
jgi:uncharacterized protein (TIGR03086 family)